MIVYALMIKAFEFLLLHIISQLIMIISIILKHVISIINIIKPGWCKLRFHQRHNSQQKYSVNQRGIQ